MLLRGFVFLSLVLGVAGCDKVSSFMNKMKGENAPAAAENMGGEEGMGADAGGDMAAAAPPQETCENGDLPQVLSGSCQGSWKVTQRDGGTFCEFDWGPTIKCPEGTKALTYEAVCYGTTSNPVDGGASVSVSQCAGQFGEFPKSPAYELKCCAI